MTKKEALAKATDMAEITLNIFGKYKTYEDIKDTFCRAMDKGNKQWRQYEDEALVIFHHLHQEYKSSN